MAALYLTAAWFHLAAPAPFVRIVPPLVPQPELVVWLTGLAELLGALALAEVTEGSRHGNRSWMVRGKTFAWERPFSKADIRRFGESAPPSGPILGVMVDDLGEKEAVLAANPKAFFTIPHFDGYAAVLIQLDKVGKRAVRDALLDGWLACAPAQLREGYLSS